MGFYSRLIFPHIMESLSAGQHVQEQRRLTLAAARGQVLEIGFGTGLNFAHYPASVVHVTAIDRERMQPRKVQGRVAAAPVPIKAVCLDASGRLPFEDNYFDTVVTTWTLCPIADVGAALAEIGRVLKRNGFYLFLEHGRSEDTRLARRQDLLSPVVRVIGSGCRMNRKIDQVISSAGLEIVAHDRFRMPDTPRILGEIYRGVARSLSLR